MTDLDFNKWALDLTVQEYMMLCRAGDPLALAAFGIAVMSLRERMNMSLLHAAEMLRLELERIDQSRVRPQAG